MDTSNGQTTLPDAVAATASILPLHNTRMIKASTNKTVIQSSHLTGHNSLAPTKTGLPARFCGVVDLASPLFVRLGAESSSD